MSATRSYRWLLIATIAAALVVCSAFALREYNYSGALAVLVILGLTVAPFALLTGFPATTLLVFTLALIGFEAADRVKMALLKSHIQLPDFFLLRDLLLAGDVGLSLDYWQITLGVLAAMLFAGGLAYALYRFERRERFPVSLRVRLPLAALAVVALAGVLQVFFSSLYVQTVRLQHPARMINDLYPARLSVVMIGAREYMRLASLMHGLGTAQAAEGQVERCQNCPDLIIVHVESVFDPDFTPQYADMKPFAAILGEGMASSYAGLMRTNVWGGFSWVTEFEVMCGLNHKLFGWAGLYTHYNVAPLLHGCLGNELKRVGYETAALYSMSSSLINVGSAFKRYGVDTFLDSRDLELPASRLQIRDGVMVDRLLAQLDKPADKPRFFWLSTIWNHGPHGYGFQKDSFEGPYDPARAGDPALADYVNRLNESVTAFSRLKDYVRASKRPMAVMFYGDHHPAFQKQYAPWVVKRFASQDLDYLTPLAFVGNRIAAKASNTPQVLSAEDTALAFLRFAGLRAPPGLERLKEITNGCGGLQLNCTEAARRRLLAVYGNR